MAEQPSFEENRLAKRVTWLAAAVLATLPGIAALRAWLGGWVPSSDWSVVVSLSWDTFSKYPRVIGQWTSLSQYANKDLFQLGPLQFWLLAVPEHLFAPSPVGAVVGSALIATGALVVTLVVAWRRGGPGMLALTTVVLTLLVLAVGPQVIRDPYNPSVALIGLIGYLAAAWAIACEDDWFWPALVFFGSVSAQTHLTYLIPLGTVGLLVVAMLVVRRARRARRSTPLRSRSSTLKILAATLATTFACWSGPFANQFWGSGNLFAVLGAGNTGVRPVGFKSALHRLVDQLAIPPGWTKHVFPKQSPTVQIALSKNPPPTAWALASAAVVGIIFLVGLVMAWRRRDHTRLTLGLVVAAAVVGATASSARLPDETIALLATTNRFFWWPIGAFIWIFVLLTLGDGVARLARRRGHVPSRRVPLALLGASSVLVVVLAIMLVARASPAYDQGSLSFGEIHQFAEAAKKACARGDGVVSVTGDIPARSAAVGGLTAMLLLNGCDVHTLNVLYYGYQRAITGDEPVAFFISGSDQPPPGYHLVAKFDPDHPPAGYEGYNELGFLSVRRITYLYELDR